jgi:hypothetical protein
MITSITHSYRPLEGESPSAIIDSIAAWLTRMMKFYMDLQTEIQISS